jgi:hypothetical protein
VNDALESEVWRAIALSTLSLAPDHLRQVFVEMGQVPDEKTIRQLREWNQATADRLQIESLNEIYRTSFWRH